MAITSKNQICDMALSHMGNYGSVNDIDNPKGDSKTITMSLWYDNVRQQVLRLMVPNFAMQRRVIAKVENYVPVFGYKNAYEYPADCLKVLGFGEIDEKAKNYAIEGPYILMDDDYPDGLPLRFIFDETDVSKFTPDFKTLLSWFLASATAMPITQKLTIKQYVDSQLPAKISECSGIAAQENPPIRVSHSRFREARFFDPSRNGVKR